MIIQNRTELKSGGKIACTIQGDYSGKRDPYAGQIADMFIKDQWMIQKHKDIKCDVILGYPVDAEGEKIASVHVYSPYFSQANRRELARKVAVYFWPEVLGYETAEYFASREKIVEELTTFFDESYSILVEKVVVMSKPEEDGDNKRGEGISPEQL